MRDYGKVSPLFWIGDTGKHIRKLGRDCQVIALYLMTGPDSNMIGLYYLAIPRLCHETGISFEGARKALARLSEGPSKGGFCYYDEVSETIFIPEMARFQIGESLKPGDKQIKGIIRECKGFIKSPFLIDFYEKYKHAFKLPEDGPWKGLTRGLEGSCKGLRSQEQEQEQEQEQDIPPIVPRKRGPRKKNFFEVEVKNPEGLAKFWEAYPKKVDYGKVKEIWNELNPTPELVAEILAKLTVAKRSKDWLKDDMAWVQKPQNWLKAEGWKNVLSENPSAAAKVPCESCNGDGGFVLHNRNENGALLLACWCMNGQKYDGARQVITPEKLKALQDKGWFK